MKSELSFLIELLLDQKVPTDIKSIIGERIKEIEEAYRPPTLTFAPLSPTRLEQTGHPQQAPSTQRNLEQHPDLTKPIVAATPVAQAALARRDAIIKAAGSEKPEPGRTSPRKF